MTRLLRQVRAHTVGLAVAALVLVGGVGLAGCGSTMEGAGASTGSSGTGAGASAGASGTGTSTGASGAKVVYVTQSQNGSHVTAGVGQTVLLVLYSSYWSPPTLAPSGVLVPTAKPSPSPSGLTPSALSTSANCGSVHHVPGSGCGVFEFAYTAAAPGTVTVSTTRSTCGEAMACAEDQRSFSVTVNVIASS